MADDTSMIIYRGSTGLGFLRGPPVEGKYNDFEGEGSTSCKEMVFSKDGSYCAWCNGLKVKVIATSSFNTVCEIDKPRTMCLAFSPKGTYLATWEPYSAKATPQESCNLFIWDVMNGECVKGFIQKKQANWSPEWTDDEYLCSRNVSNEVHFFEKSNFDQIAKKIHVQKVVAFSLAPGDPDYHISCYVPGIKGQPSFIRIYKYPIFEGTNAIIAQRSFFKADCAEMFWNKIGKDLLVQSAVEVDRSGASYYGEQNLYYLSAKGETAMVKLGKDGPIYAIQWHPNSKQFGVVYGYMPAKATLYNLKCEPVFDFDTGPRNEIHFNMTGNRVILCGFGNLRGNVEVWDTENKKKVVTFVANDSTYLSWSPDGEYILTATMSPRLRVGNGYRFWHYTGSLLSEKYINMGEELWDMKWKPVPVEKLMVKKTIYVPVPGIKSAVPQASKEAYRPPGARGQPSSFKLHDDKSSNNAAQPLSKNQKKKKAKKDKEKTDVEPKDESITNVCPPVPQTPAESEKLPASTGSITGDPVADKRIRGLLRKLDQIDKLKKEVQSGKTLEKNQVDKIQKEEEILAELRKLEM